MAQLRYSGNDGRVSVVSRRIEKPYLNKAAIGGFANDYYWSSTEYDILNAWFQNFASGYQDGGNKASSYVVVRAVRAF